MRTTTLLLALTIIVSGCTDIISSESDEEETPETPETTYSQINADAISPDNFQTTSYDDQDSTFSIYIEQNSILELEDLGNEEHVLTFEDEEYHIEGTLFSWTAIDDELAIVYERQDETGTVIKYQDEIIENAEKSFNFNGQLGYINRTTEQIELKNGDIDFEQDNIENVDIDMIGSTGENIFYTTLDISRDIDSMMDIYKNGSTITEGIEDMQSLVLDSGDIYWIDTNLEGEDTLMKNEETLATKEGILFSELEVYEGSAYYISAGDENTEIMKEDELFETVEDARCSEIEIVRETTACAFTGLDNHEEEREFINYDGLNYGPYDEVHSLHNIDDTLAMLVTIDEDQQTRFLLKEE